MKKITFLMLHLNYGGIEKQVTTLANLLTQKYKIEIIALYDILNGKSFYNLDKRIKVKYLLPYGPNKNEIKNSLKKFKIITFFKECAKTIKILWYKYHKIGKIANTTKTDILVSSRIEFAKQIKRDDIITVSQEHSYIDTKKYIRKVKKSFKHINYLVVMTKLAANKYKEWLMDAAYNINIVVIPNIIEKTNITSTLNYNQIISIGRLEDVKDFPTLIDVFEMVHKKHNEVKLKIIGEGSKRKELEEKIEKLNLKDYITLTGRLDKSKIYEELSKSDIFVLPSKSESFSLSIGEAMSCGVPCISFDIDVGPKEIITNNEDGFLILNRSKNNMYEKICYLIENVNKRHEFGMKAKENIQRFYPENIVHEWEKIFK